jgi:hypothetical protein
VSICKSGSVSAGKSSIFDVDIAIPPSLFTARIISLSLKRILRPYCSTAFLAAFTISSLPAKLFSTRSAHWLSANFSSSPSLNPKSWRASFVVPVTALK